MRRILLFVASFLLLVGYLYFHQKDAWARIWSSDDCQSCTDLNCCGSRCESEYFCNNLGFGICFCDKEKEEIPPTSTPGPRPPAPTQPGGGGGGGGGPTPTGGYVLGNICQRNPACGRSCNPQTQDCPDGYYCWSGDPPGTASPVCVAYCCYGGGGPAPRCPGTTGIFTGTCTWGPCAGPDGPLCSWAQYGSYSAKCFYNYKKTWDTSPHACESVDERYVGGPGNLYWEFNPASAEVKKGQTLQVSVQTCYYYTSEGEGYYVEAYTYCDGWGGNYDVCAPGISLTKNMWLDDNYGINLGSGIVEDPFICGDKYGSRHTYYIDTSNLSPGIHQLFFGQGCVDTQRFTVYVEPKTVSLTPSSSTVVRDDQTFFAFTAVYKHEEGVGKFNNVQLIIGPDANWKNPDGSWRTNFLRLMYHINTKTGEEDLWERGKFYLFSPPSPTATCNRDNKYCWVKQDPDYFYLENSAVKFDYNFSTISFNSDGDLVISWKVAFKPGFAPGYSSLKMYLYVDDIAGHQYTDQPYEKINNFYFHQYGNITISQ